MRDKNSTQANKFFSNIEDTQSSDYNPPILVGDNLKTPENIGSLLRLAGSIGCNSIYITDTDPEDVRLSKVKKTATTAFNKVDIIFTPTSDLIKKLKDSDYRLIGIETAEGSKNIFKSSIPKKVAIFIGNESHGLSTEIINSCNDIFYIPMPGIVKSLNVTNAAAVVLFEWYRQNH
jgi:tRNA G18 (ribose-2'-O)-methylase SpoU